MCFVRVVREAKNIHTCVSSYSLFIVIFIVICRQITTRSNLSLIIVGFVRLFSPVQRLYRGVIFSRIQKKISNIFLEYRTNLLYST